jgi:SynChlorMet cassette radical SAM/SPASM protein ScmF
MDQMESVIRLAESIGAGSVKFNIVQPIARGGNLHETMGTLSIEQLVEIGEWVENELSPSTRLRVVFSHPIAFRPFGRMLGEDRRNGCGRCGICSILGVLSDGSYALCGIGVTVPELVFGRADRDSLEEVWSNTAVLKEIREGLPERLEGVCNDCVLKRSCLGYCLAMNYGTSNNLWAPFWYCDMAEKAGLFPESRLRSSLARLAAS